MSQVLIRQILVGLFVLSSVLATINFGMLPQFASFQEKIDSANQVDLIASIELEELRRLQALDAVKPVIESQLVELEEAIPKDFQYSAFVDILDALADQSDVDINFLTIGDTSPYSPPETIATEPEVQPALEKVAGRLSSIPVDFSVSGSFNNLLNFMGQLQKSPRTTVIQVVSLSGTGGQVNLTLQTSIYSIAPSQ